MIGRPHPGVLAPMLGEVNPLARHAHGTEGGFAGRPGRADEGEHRAVVRGIRLDIQQLDPGHRLYGVAKGAQHILAAALTEIGHAFDKSAGHTREG